MTTDTPINPFYLKKLKEWRSSALQFVNDCIEINPTTQQLELLSSIAKYQRVTVRSGHGCHAKNTIVHMYPYGFKFVQDVEVGDLLMGDDGTSREVLELIRGKEEMARIKYHDGTYYDVNLSHILPLVCTGSKCEFSSGDKLELSVMEYLDMIADRPSLKGRFAGYKVSIEYPEIPVLIPPYILGVWLGDGTHNRPQITNIDRSIIGLWQIYGESIGLKMRTDSNGKDHSLTLSKEQQYSGFPNPFIKALKHYNLFENKHIPKEYLFTSKRNRLLLLAGLLDTDGYANKTSGLTFEITQKRRDLAEDIVFLCQSVGIHASIKETKKSWTYINRYGISEKRWGVYFRVFISRNTELIPTQVERKQYFEGVDKQRPNLHFGFNVELLPEDNYYGFKVDKNHLYVLGDFTVTHNCGKDGSAACVAQWFLSTRPYSKVIVTAPTNRQLRDIFLAEFVKWLRNSSVAGDFVVQKDTVFHKHAQKEWWLRLVSPSVRSNKEEQAETLAGFHGDNMLIIVDEASGVPDPVYIPLEGAMTNPGNKVLLIGNMTKNMGYFYDTHFHASISKDWHKIHWRSTESEIVDSSMPEYFARKYGVDSNIYKIRVLGEPPVQDENTLIPLWAAIQCIGQEFDVAEDEPLYLGVDVARYGNDSSIILPRKGLKIYPWETFNKLNTIDLGGFINQTYQEVEASGVAIDVIGVGAGVADWLTKRKIANLYEVNVTHASSDIEKYHRLRDELWCKVRDNCLLGKYSFPDTVVEGDQEGKQETLGNMLANELASPRYAFNAHGGIVVESKKDMKVRGINSPNIADALCMTEYFHNSATRVFTNPQDKANATLNKYFLGQNIHNSTGWLGS